MSITILLNTISVITLIVALSISIWSIVIRNRDASDSGSTGTTGTSLPSCIDITAPSSLIQIPENQPHCFQQGRETNLFYIGDLDPDFDYVVAPYTTSPLDVCIGFCTAYSDGTCQGANFQGRTAQQNFDSCISQLTPTDCVPPLPIAAQGAILYYALSPTSIICESS